MTLMYYALFLFGLVSAAAGRSPEKLNCRADIAFVVDSSRSIWIEDFKQQKNFIADVVRRFDIGADDVQISALSFSSTTQVDFRFDDITDEASALDAVDRLGYTAGGSTRTYLALNQMRTDLFSPGNGARSDAVHIAIVLTDGVTNPGRSGNFNSSTAKLQTQIEAQMARDLGIMVFAIGIGDKTDTTELQGIASKPSERFVVEVHNYTKLNTETIKNLLSSRTCYAAATTTTARPVTHKPDPGDIVAGKECQGKAADVVFVIDQSTSIRSTEMFRTELSFVNSVIDYFDISPNKTQVSVIKFSNNSELMFPLNRYTTRDTLKSAVNDIAWEGGDTHTELALEMLLKQGFSKRNGARKEVVQIGVIITDGGSTEPRKTELVAQRVLNKGIIMFAIGVGGYNRNELNRIASNPSSRYVKTVDNLDVLKTIKVDLAYSVCKEKGENNTERCSNRMADIVFVADASTSISSQSMFNKELAFIASLVNKFHVSRDTIRVALITFANDTRVEFRLDTYGSDGEIKNALSRVVWSTGLTFTAEAIQAMTRDVFQQARTGVPKIGIIITDGGSREPSKTLQAAREAKSAGIKIFTIGVGPYFVERELTAMASEPSNVYFHMVSDFSSLQDIENLLLQNTCEVASPIAFGKREGHLYEEKDPSLKSLMDYIRGHL